jgi:hypothetical protein
VDVDGLILQVLPLADGDAEEPADLAGRLLAELLDVDAASVAPLTAEAAVRGEGTRGDGRLASGPVRDPGRATSRGSCRAGRASRTDRTVEVSIGGDVLKVTAVTSRQQEKVINAWLTRHSPSL